MWMNSQVLAFNDDTCELAPFCSLNGRLGYFAVW